MFGFLLLRCRFSHLVLIRFRRKSDPLYGGYDGCIVDLIAADRQLFGNEVDLRTVGKDEFLRDAFHGRGTGGAMHAADFECFDHSLSILNPGSDCKSHPRDFRRKRMFFAVCREVHNFVAFPRLTILGAVTIIKDDG